jgi:hypothetical protein
VVYLAFPTIDPLTTPTNKQWRFNRVLQTSTNVVYEMLQVDEEDGEMWFINGVGSNNEVSARKQSAGFVTHRWRWRHVDARNTPQFILFVLALNIFSCLLRLHSIASIVSNTLNNRAISGNGDGSVRGRF